MKLSCTKYMLFLAVGLLLLGLAACTQSKPVVPTATLPASGPPILPQGGTLAATPGLTQGTPPPASTLAPAGTSVPGQPTVAATPKPGQPTVAATKSTTGPVTLATPTPFGSTQPGVTPSTGPQPAETPSGGTEPGPTGQETNPPTATGACSNPYVVQRGEWLYAIARKCGVTPGAIIAANPMIDPNNVRPGQSLVMPGGGSTSGGGTTGGGTTTGNTYVVQRGDTMFSIARRFNITVQALMAVNGITNPNFIFAGQVLTIPQ